MSNTTVTRKERAETLTKQIRAGLAARYRAGLKLKQIRDDELYKADGFETWREYLKSRWDWTAKEANQLIKLAESWKVTQEIVNLADRQTQMEPQS